MSSARRNARGPRLIGALLPQVTGKVLAKQGFPNMSLITDWPAIVGPELAAYTCPEKMSWPRKPNEHSDDEGSTPARRRQRRQPEGITLKLRVESHRALDVQYSLDAILDRINSYFGYRAVTAIRIVQGPVQKPSDDHADHNDDHIKSDATAPLADLSTIKDDGLRAALARLDEARRR